MMKQAGYTTVNHYDREFSQRCPAESSPIEAASDRACKLHGYYMCMIYNRASGSRAS